MVSAVWVGMKEVEAAFTKVAAGADEASKEALVKMGADVVKRAMHNFHGSHAKGQPHVGSYDGTRNAKGQFARGAAKAGDPPNIVTGNLRRSIQMGQPIRYGVADWMVKVTVGAYYGEWVEFGTSRAGAHPYFTPAVDASRPSWAGTIADSWAKFVI